MNKLTLGSLFSGSGGFELAGQIAGIKPIWNSEIDPFCIAVTQKNFPDVKHYGDVSAIDGGKIEPVDIITFGSPCQDLSIAGKRDGLGGMRSGLFYEAIRIIKEMRCATNGKYPRYAVWENVPGAFSSNCGEDFRTVLEEICRIKDERLSVPKHEKWYCAGEILADDFSLAWRVLDARYWGVPQRRRRIYLVADFAGESAGKILFESESLSWNSKKSGYAQKSTAGDTENCPGDAGRVVLNDRGGERMDVTYDVVSTLRAEAHHPPCVLESAGFCTEHSSKARGIGYEKEKAPTLRAGVTPAVLQLWENHGQDTRYTGPHETAPTVSATYGTGGNNQPFVTECYDIRLTSEGTKNARANVYKTDISRTLDTSIPTPDKNQGGLAVVAYSTSKNSHHTHAEKDMASTLVATDYKDSPVVVYGIGRDAFNQGKNAKFSPSIAEELQPTMVAKGPGAVQVGYTVRRLTPIECARLQGFADDWCDDLGNPNPTDEQLAFWRDVWETYRNTVTHSSKPKSEKQTRKWLSNPYSDSAVYKMYGNGIALPCAVFVLSGIANTTLKSTGGL